MSRFKALILTEKSSANTLISTFAAAWVGAIGFVGMFTYEVFFNRPQTPVDVAEEVDSYLQAGRFAENYVKLFLTGGKVNEAALAQMMTANTSQPLPPTPYTGFDFNASHPHKRQAGSNVEWAVTVGATLIPPGRGSASRHFFCVNIIGSKYQTMKAMYYPRPCDNIQAPFTVQTVYTQGVGQDTALWQTVSNFISAYYQSDNDGQLGRFVTGDFTMKPIHRSPFAGVKVTGILASNTGPTVPDARPGDRVNVMVTVTGSSARLTTSKPMDATGAPPVTAVDSAATTWVPFQVPLTVVLADNQQWLVEGIDEYIDFGDFEPK